MHRFVLTVSLSMAAAAAVPVAAQNGNASGVVTELGRPFAGAPVVIDGTKTVLTDQDGRFTETLPEGDHTIQIALHGYQPQQHSVTAARNQVLIADFALEPLLQIAALTVPSSLMQGQAGRALLLIKNSAATPYSIDAVSLSFLSPDGRDRGAEFTAAPDPSNPTIIGAGQTVSLGFSIQPASAAGTGPVTVRASVLAFDTAMGKNLLANGSFESGDTSSAFPWHFSLDNGDLLPGATAAIVTGTAMTGSRSVQIHVPVALTGLARAYWSQDAVPIQPGKTYVVSGYVKTDSVQSDAGFGAVLYLPVLHNAPLIQPNAPFITGSRDWRKEQIVFQTSGVTDNGGDHMEAWVRGELQQATGVAWFDNLSLTEGTEDGSLTLTGGDQALSVAAMPPVTPPTYTPPPYNPGGYYPGY
jgi:hypothetical protein